MHAAWTCKQMRLHVQVWHCFILLKTVFKNSSTYVLHMQGKRLVIVVQQLETIPKLSILHSAAQMKESRLCTGLQVHPEATAVARDRSLHAGA